MFDWFLVSLVGWAFVGEKSFCMFSGFCMSSVCCCHGFFSGCHKMSDCSKHPEATQPPSYLVSRGEGEWEFGAGRFEG